MEPLAPPATHEVTNQTPPLEHYNLYTTDAALMAALAREGAGWHAPALARDGALLGTPDVLALAALANRHTPELFTYSPRGERIDTLEFHPSWHRLLELLRAEGLHALPFSDPRQGAMAARCAGYFLHAQLESGSLCPLTMTFASISVLRREPVLFASLAEKLYSREHDPRDAPLAEKRSMMVGMGMTEKQGGSDVRMNQTRAYAIDAGGRGAAYRLDRSQVVLLGAAMRCSSRACTRRRRRGHFLLLCAAFRARRQAKRDPGEPPEGQARQPVEREQGSGIPRGVWRADRRSRARRADDHRNGQLHAARLRDRKCRV